MQPFAPDSVGTQDFTLYYVAFQAWRQGLNPYDPVVFQQVAHQVFGPGAAIPDYAHFLYLPVVFTLLSPVLFLPFQAACLGWIALSLSALFAAPFVISKALAPRETIPIPFILVLCLFPPGLECLRWGQTGLVLGFLVCLIFFTLQRERDLLAGALSSLLLVKPQLFLLVFIWLGVLIVRSRRFAIVLGGTAAVGIQVALLGPQLIAQWWHVGVPLAKNDLVGIRGAVPGHALKRMLQVSTGLPADWLPATVTVVGMLLAVWMLLRSRLENETAGICSFPAMLCLSLIAAPYGWFHDFSVLLLPLGVALSPGESRPTKALSLVLLLEAFTELGKQLVFNSQDHYCWYPAAVLLIFLAAKRHDSPGSIRSAPAAA